MNPNDFVVQEKGKYRFHIGHYVASSLSGFIAGAVVASIIWLAGIYIVSGR